MKVIMLGLDGMTLKVIEPYVKENLLPNFKKIMEHGAHGVLSSTVPSVTGPAWTSLGTGKNPGKHGIYEFRTRDGYKTNIITKNTSVNAKPVWNILSRNGKRVAVINVPFTYPPDEVNGVMISGMMTPNINTDFVYPKEFKKELFELIPRYRLEINISDFLRTNKISAFLKTVTEVTGSRRKLMNYLLEKNSPDLLFIVYTGPDRVQHVLWDQVVEMDPGCVKFYQLLDEIVGDVLKRTDDDTVLFIVSDHGFMSSKKAFNINAFFRKMGLLEIRGNSEMKLKKPTFLVYRFLNRLGFFALKKYLPTRIVNMIRNYLLTIGIEGKIDWDKTRVFSLLMYGLIHINLKGREPRGIVDQEDYQQLRETVRKELLDLNDPETGRKVIKNVFKGDEIYSSENIQDHPDLVVEMNEGYFIEEKYFGDDIWANENEVKHTGNHDRNGLIMAYGKIINHMKIDADIIDIMPTLLYIMGTAIPEDVDGRVVTEMIDHNFVNKNNINFEASEANLYPEGSTLDEDELEEVEKQLKNLGYFS